MSDVRISEYTKVTGGADFQALADQGIMHVILWDTGPRKPVQPKRPEPPKGKEGEPEYDLAVIEFAEKRDEYAAALKAFAQAKKDYAEWHEKWGGPYELRMYSVDAYDALQRDEHRYYISASTRGNERRPNHGLPPGMKPGKGHFENLKRIEEGESDVAAARRRDPVFGEQELRP